ncbi:cell envelope integrity protein TolA [Acidithiobacillus ferrivorans]|uniref:cell envelope integrity protein TolA n=1 Tax=Acidithiobacillus ferrivorans TaxID=160808 RepID=UPI001C077115|nr:cell envelope integrity protein TolA [Acidithiobacillus ferrivorans]MBU2851959.1 cell envelope integrity protein TolA [Acidithiobacillus ferrivorans]
MKRLIIATMLALGPVTALANAASYSAAMNKADISCLKPYRGLKHLTQSEKNTFTTCVNHAEITDLEKYEPKVVAAMGGKQQMVQGVMHPQKPAPVTNKLSVQQFANEIESDVLSHFHPGYGSPGSGILTIDLARDGKITGVAVSSSTGDSKLNSLAERAAKEAGQFTVPSGIPYHIYKTVSISFYRRQRTANAIPCSKPGINTYMRRNFDNWAQDSDRSYRYVHTMPVLTVSGGPHTTVCEAWIMEKVPNTGFWYKNLATIWVHHKPGTDMDYTRVSGLN